MKRKHWVVLGIVVLALTSLVAVWWPGGSSSRRAVAGRQIAVITIDGPISGGSSSGWLETTVAARDVVEQLRKAREDAAVRAVVIRMNTPGGSAAASQEVAEAIRRVRAAGKPVVVSIGDLGASGGYWIAATANRIVANPASLTGSIGVIMELTHYEELYEKLGVDVETIKSGPYKDIGSTTRPPTDAERQILQSMVNDIFQQFVDVVAEGRRLRREEVLQLADGRLFTGRQAMEVGLVDELGTFEDATDLAASLAGLDDYRLVEYGTPGSLLDLLRWWGAAGAGNALPAARALADALGAKLVRLELYHAVPR